MYKRTFWKDHVEGIQEGTDMNATNFNNIEAGTMEAHALAALNAAQLRYSADVAKNSEVIVVYEHLVTPWKEHFIEIPAAATRNNSNYNVTVDIETIEGGQEGNGAAATVCVYDKQANGFKAHFSGTGSALVVRFLISGGMI